MKFIWEAKDISCGRIVCKPNPNPKSDFEPCGWTSKHTYKIGWLADGNPKKDYITPKDLNREEREAWLDENRADYCLVCMTDGMILTPLTKKQMVENLNMWEYIPMPHDWFVKTVEYLRNINERGNG